MGDCHHLPVPPSSTPAPSDDRYCKLPWCPNCEHKTGGALNSTSASPLHHLHHHHHYVQNNHQVSPKRRNSRGSETVDQRRLLRSSKETMKTTSPRKHHHHHNHNHHHHHHSSHFVSNSNHYNNGCHGNNQEYENMDLEYDLKEFKDTNLWYEPKEQIPYRIRSNLCELPTSYITNNYQNSHYGHGQEMALLTNDKAPSLRRHHHHQDLRDLCQTSPLKLPPPPQPLAATAAAVAAPPVSAPLTRLKRSNNGYCHDNNIKQQNGYHHTQMTNDNHVVMTSSACNNSSNSSNSNNSIPKNLVFNKQVTSILGNCKIEFGFEKDLNYETGTYFDKILDMNGFHDRYRKEIEAIKERNGGYKKLEPVGGGAASGDGGGSGARAREKSQDRCSRLADTSQKSSDTVITTTTTTTNNTQPPPAFKPKKICIKTRSKLAAVKLRKAKSKVTNFTEISDCSSSSPSDDESEPENDGGDEESESVSENLWPEESKKSAQENEESGGGDMPGWPVRPSLFPNVPPYIRFSPHDLENVIKVPNGRKFFKWKLSTITPIVVRKTLSNSGFALVRSEFSRESNQWMGTWGKHMKSPMFKTLKDTQKLNHFPGTFQLGRKDRLWRNFQRLIKKFGYKEFGFIPQTYVLPQELKLLKQNWEYKNGSGREIWIIKPPASARGVGIQVINKWSQLPKKTSLVVQKYIANPYLINGSKFDLRLYVLVTSFDPLRIYLYPEGLARFASAKYSDDAKDLKDRYMHLTNYSINKLSSQYTANEDANACQGHKWTLTKLFEYMEKDGIDTKSLWRNLQQLVIKTIITGEGPINHLCEENMLNRYNCYELFGIDVLLDEHLKPWLLEVNISPSLHSSSPLDAHVKGPLVHMLFDLAQFHFPPRLAQTIPQSPKCLEPKLYSLALTKRERDKHNLFVQFDDRQSYLNEILMELTGDDVRRLLQAEDEFVVKGKFERIFPTAQTHRYLEFVETRYYNRLFDAWETKYEKNRQQGIDILKGLCEEKLHLKVAPQSALNKNSPSTTPVTATMNQSKESLQNRPLADAMEEVSLGTSPSSKEINQ